MLFFLLVVFPAFFPAFFPARAEAQNNPAAGADTAVSAEDPPEDESAPVIFPLIPLLEAGFNGELRWRPDWPDTIPPDGFLLAGEKREARRMPFALSLSNGTETFGFERDGAGRLREFPFFLRNARLSVKAAYDYSGAMLSMNVRAAAVSENGTGGKGDGESEDVESEITETTWDIEFPPDFFPYGGASPGGDFPPAKVFRGDTVFFVFFFESRAFFSETWYDGEGNPLAFFRANVRPENGSWTVQALYSRDEKGPQSEEYSFDSGGNISGIRSPEGTFSALYRDNLPRYWERQSVSRPPAAFSRAALQWDEQGLLLGISFEYPIPAAGGIPAASGEIVPVETGAAPLNAEEAGPPALEYRYQYERDAAGNWISRQDIAVINRFGILIPRPGRSWTRRISFAGN
jgi:hypothetical protein